MNPEHNRYIRFSSKERLHKSIQTLIGIVEGIDIDKAVNPKEIHYLMDWMKEHKEFRDRHPFNEIIPVIEQALSDNIMTQEEKDDILWLCNKLVSSEFQDNTSAGLRTLHGVLAGIAADGVILEKELRGLQRWLAENEWLRTCWPYDEVDALMYKVLKDRKIDKEEHRMLMNFFSEFANYDGEQAISSAPILINGNIAGLFAVDPQLVFKERVFCFTGASAKDSRAVLAEKVRNFGGVFTNYMNQKVDYLVVGADGNPCWQYACYGRKIEEAVTLRQRGSNLLIVHEFDFHDAYADQR